MEQQSMFPDYVFLESEDGERLARELKQYRSFLMILGEKETLIPIGREEEAFLR